MWLQEIKSDSRGGEAWETGDCKSFGVMGIVTEAIPKSDRPQDKTPGPASATPPLTWAACAPCAVPYS